MGSPDVSALLGGAVRVQSAERVIGLGEGPHRVGEGPHRGLEAVPRDQGISIHDEVVRGRSRVAGHLIEADAARVTEGGRQAAQLLRDLGEQRPRCVPLISCRVILLERCHPGPSVPMRIMGICP